MEVLPDTVNGSCVLVWPLQCRGGLGSVLAVHSAQLLEVQSGDAVQSCAVQLGAVQSCAVQCSDVQSCAVQ